MLSNRIKNYSLHSILNQEVSMINKKFSTMFAEKWINAFNSHDLESIFDLYDNNFTMESPYIRERMGIKSGILIGKNNIRPYWEKSFALSPPLKFKLINVFMGVTIIVVYYESIGRNLVCEIFEFNDKNKIIRGSSQHSCLST